MTTRIIQAISDGDGKGQKINIDGCICEVDIKNGSQLKDAIKRGLFNTIRQSREKVNIRKRLREKLKEKKALELMEKKALE